MDRLFLWHAHLSGWLRSVELRWVLLDQATADLGKGKTGEEK